METHTLDPVPDGYVLQAVVEHVRLRFRDWRFWLHSGSATWSSGSIVTETPHNTVGRAALLYPATLVIDALVDDSETGKPIVVQHRFPVPDPRMLPVGKRMPASWKRYVLDCVLAVSTHEICEVFDIDGERPFYPDHRPQGDPYAIREHA